MLGGALGALLAGSFLALDAVMAQRPGYAEWTLTVGWMDYLTPTSLVLMTVGNESADSLAMMYGAVIVANGLLYAAVASALGLVVRGVGWLVTPRH